MYLTSAMSRQGLLRRILFDYIKPEDLTMDNWMPPIQIGYNKVWDELKSFAVDDIVPLMLKCEDLIKKKGEGHLLNAGLESELEDEIIGRAKEIDASVIKHPSDYNIYRQTQWEYEVKLSILRACVTDGLNPEGLLAEQKHLDLAKKHLKVLGTHTQEMMDDLTIGEKMREEEKLKMKVLNKIREAGEIRRSDLLNGIRGVNAKRLFEISLELKTAELIEIKTQGKTVTYLYKSFSS